MRKKLESRETPKERFRRLATLRTQAVLKRLQILGNCANRYVYDYDESDIEKIFLEIERSVRKTKAKYLSHKKRDEFK